MRRSRPCSPKPSCSARIGLCEVFGGLTLDAARRLQEAAGRALYIIKSGCTRAGLLASSALLGRFVWMIRPVFRALRPAFAAGYGVAGGRFRVLGARFHISGARISRCDAQNRTLGFAIGIWGKRIGICGKRIGICGKRNLNTFFQIRGSILQNRHLSFSILQAWKWVPKHSCKFFVFIFADKASRLTSDN